MASRLALLACLFAAPATGQSDKIKNVILLMLENRSFDSFLGWMKRSNPVIDGLTGQESNLMNPADPNSERVFVNDALEYVIPRDLGHSVASTSYQIFGEPYPEPDPLPETAPMSGFVADYVNNRNGLPENAMGAFPEEKVSSTSTLASEFAVFDRWFSSFPGNTQPNRFFLHSATSDGMTVNDVARMVIGMPQKTIYEQMAENNLTWTNYFQEVPSILLHRWARRPANWNFKHYSAFLDDVANGELPNLSFLDPRYFDFGPNAPQNDNHPSSADVYNGEAFVKELYEAVVASPQWNETLLIITYDEHGGFYDHVAPPANVPSPDGKMGDSPYEDFDFTRLGARVPTVMVSPWIPKGTVVNVAPEAQRPTSSSEYEASSVAATLHKIFNLGNSDFLTERDAWASTFEHIWETTTSPRTDHPRILPEVPRSSFTPLPPQEQSLDQLQIDFVSFAMALNGKMSNIDEDINEYDASIMIKEEICEFFGRCVYDGEDMYEGKYCHLAQNFIDAHA